MNTKFFAVLTLSLEDFIHKSLKELMKFTHLQSGKFNAA